jgi:hypothetical protein
MCKFRELRADEIECRVQSVKQNGLVLLLYKDARVDMNILDETVGAVNWQNKFYEHKDILFCSLGINTNYDKPELPDRWIWKDDAGVESNTEAEKGNASDARKRSGFAWGIGRELYTAPFTWIPSDKCSITGGKCFDKFEVKSITIHEKRITSLEIWNATKKCVAFSWALSVNAPKQEPKKEAPKKEQPITYTCVDCGMDVDGAMAARTQKAFGVILCKDCGVKRAKTEVKNNGEGDAQ